MKRNIAAICAMVGALSLSAQDWKVDGNNSLDPDNNYVGNNDDVPLNFRTDSVWRMRLWDTDVTTLNSFPGIIRDGFLGISPVEDFYNNPGAFTRLHLVDSGAAVVNYAQDFGYRPWMRNGVTMTGNSDQMYIGHKYTYVDSTDYTSGEINDRSDAVIEWSDNPDDAPWGTDRLRFMFTNDYSVAAPADFGARSLEGMEAMRIFIPTDTTANVGIGDFFRAGVINGQNEDPTERLHVNDGTIRIDSLIRDYRNDTLHQVLMSDMTGRVHWRNVNTLPTGGGGGGGCEWGSDAPTGRIYTAFQTNTTNGVCPEEDWKVGIGVAFPAAKLDVFGKYSMIAQPTGINSVYKGDATLVAGQIGVSGDVSAESTSIKNGTGLNGAVTNVSVTGVGAKGTVNLDGFSTTSTVASAVYGRLNTTSSAKGTLYGLRGEVDNAGSNGTASVFGSYAKVTGTGTMSSSIGMYGASTPSGLVSNSYGAWASSNWLSGASIITASHGVLASSTGTGSVPSSYGVTASASNGTTNTIGVNSFAFGLTTTPNTIGVYGAGQGTSTTATGVSGYAANSGTGATIFRYGVQGRTAMAVNDTLARNYSVYGHNGGSGSNQWAGYFNGRTYCAGTIFVPSDAQLKTDITSIADIAGSDDDPVQKLLQLQPKSYRYNTDQFPQMGLPSGQQYGFLAQELGEQFPNMVTDMIQPAEHDSTGAETAPEVAFKAVGLQGLLPLVIEAMKRQNTRIDELEQMIAACCNAPDDGGRAVSNATIDGASAMETDLRIVPNPVADQTELRYTVGTAGRVRLEIIDARGRAIRTHDEGARSIGTFSFAWDTTLLAPGTYFCTLFVNDEPLVKKAVKLNVR